ncbi:hypothetical protein V496_06546 [Pseudogymnoascus sp. VKM F-4515 (FW-2607)]|nr:hypothetical protein V496_06546 [Pseudogymnoascus sp. VKM F-4515 (FW-2607)]
MVSLITAMAPIILRLLANMQGLYSHRAVENNVQFYYFTFLFVQIFLTVSLSAGVTTTIEELADSIEATPTVLAENLPKASNYFFSYIMMHALTTFALTLVQANGLIEMYILSPALDKSPRQKWMRGQNSGLQKWGTFVPVLTNVACIDDPSQDRIVTSAHPILWIPKDERRIAKDEIYHMTRTYCSIWISSEGAHLDERGCITLDGKPPVARGDQASMTV